ncbi:MAG: acetate--CoA ligase family protein [Anaerolineales bacterium]|nr:acetate--CoA ligase family protein [Anaerolineales bacterium]
MASDIITKVKKEGRVYLTESESKLLLKEAGIATNEMELAMFRDEAVSISKKMGYPVVLKVVSNDILHKTDVGGVKLGLDSGDEVASAYDEMMALLKQKAANAVIDGVSVQRMAHPGVEVIIGMFKDNQFGPVVMFGIGGELVEVYKDVSFGIVPIPKRYAKQMIKDIKGYPLLDGYRGRDPVDIAFLEDMLLKLSDFAKDNPDIKEVDINPVIAYADKAIAVDARVILESAA